MRGMEDGEDGTAPWSALATELRRSLAQPAEDQGLQMPVALILVVTVLVRTTGSSISTTGSWYLYYCTSTIKTLTG